MCKALCLCKVLVASMATCSTSLVCSVRFLLCSPVLALVIRLQAATANRPETKGTQFFVYVVSSLTQRLAIALKSGGTKHGEMVCRTSASISLCSVCLGSAKAGGRRGSGSSQTYAPSFSSGQTPPPPPPAVQRPRTFGSWSEASHFLHAWLRRTLMFSWMLCNVDAAASLLAG
jgi:hypothetical protein